MINKENTNQEGPNKDTRIFKREVLFDQVRKLGGYSEGDVEGMKRLWTDSDVGDNVQREVLRKAGKSLLASEDPIDADILTPENLVLLLAAADFNYLPIEVVKFAGWMTRHRQDPNQRERNLVLPYLVDFTPGGIEHKAGEGWEKMREELGFRCLMSRSFFMGALLRRYKTNAAPHPNYYLGIGIASFMTSRTPQLGHNFQNWESYLSNTFASAFAPGES